MASECQSRVSEIGDDVLAFASRGDDAAMMCPPK